MQQLAQEAIDPRAAMGKTERPIQPALMNEAVAHRSYFMNLTDHGVWNTETGSSLIDQVDGPYTWQRGLTFHIHQIQPQSILELSEHPHEIGVFQLCQCAQDITRFDSGLRQDGDVFFRPGVQLSKGKASGCNLFVDPSNPLEEIA